MACVGLHENGSYTWHDSLIKSVVKKMKLSGRLTIILIMALAVSVLNVSGIEVVVNSGGTALSEKYSLADSTSLQEKTILSGGGIFQNRNAVGSDKNTMQTYVRGHDYEASAVMNNLGQFSSESSVAASKDESLISQSIASNGYAHAEVYGAAATDEAGQQASVYNGALQSSQSLAVGEGTFAVQDTTVNGEAGVLGAYASSNDNLMEIRGGFSGENGAMNARLASASAGNAYSWGVASINGIDCLDDSISQNIVSKGLNMRLDGLYDTGTGNIGDFGFNVINQERSAPMAQVATTATAAFTGGIVDQGTHPEIVYNPSGSASSYVLLGRKIDQTKPLQIYLKTDSALTGETLDPALANNAVTLAANTWDYWTKPDQNNLFMPTVINDASKSTDVADGYSVQAFKPISGTSTLAYTRIYTNRYGYIAEADTCYNTNRVWTTDFSVAKSNRNVIDLQTVALHELGHACGLGDLYTLPSTDPRRKDTNEIMNSYGAPRHNLGAGDIKGLQSIYGV